MTRDIHLLTGIVDELEISDGELAFMNARHRRLGSVAAVGLAAAGMAGPAIGASSAAQGVGDSVQFFRCRIADSWVEGAFSRVTFKEGELMQLAVDEGSGGAFHAKAAYRTADNVLWMEPHCSRGRSAHLRFSIEISCKIALAMIIFVCLPLMWVAVRNEKDASGLMEFFGAIQLIMTMTVSLYYSIRFYRQWRSVAIHAEDIFRALRFSNPKSVDLPRENVKYSKSHGIGWPYVTDGPWIYRCSISAE